MVFNSSDFFPVRKSGKLIVALYGFAPRLRSSARFVVQGDGKRAEFSHPSSLRSPQSTQQIDEKYFFIQRQQVRKEII